MKTCTSCNHYKPFRVLGIFNLGTTHADCARPQLGLDPVSGKQKTTLCILQRHQYGGCGIEGKYWEAK